MSVDLLYVVGGETSDDREDLRYSIRSFAANLHMEYRDIWVVGDVPDWFRGMGLPLRPHPEKFANQRQSLTAYVNHPDAADQVVILNDDMYLIEPVTELMVCRLKGPLSTFREAAKTAKKNSWRTAVIQTGEWTAARTGTDVYVYEAHTPLTFDTAALRSLLSEYPAERPFAVGELYPLAGVGGEGTNRGNAKCGAESSLASKLANPMPFLSGNPDTWPGVVADYIKPRFDTPSRWEKPMLNADMIRDQKRSPGLIENPCRDALIGFAAKVPADQAIVELGSFKGRSTAQLALGSYLGRGVSVHAYDPWEDADEIDPDYFATVPSIREYRQSETRAIFTQHMVATGANEYVVAHQMTASAGAADYDGPKVGLLFHDALHGAEDVYEDLTAWLPHMADEAVVILHDTDDHRYGVEEGAQRAFTRTKALTRKWNWDERDRRPWAKNLGKPLDKWRRGFVIVRTC